MPLQVRTAGLDDAQILATLGAKTFYDTFKPYNTEEDMRSYINKAYALTSIRENLNRKDIIYLLAEQESMAIGYVKLIQGSGYDKLTGRTIELEKIYVLHEYFGSGTGAALMKSAIHISKEKGFDILFLGVWEENKRALDFYIKFGFETFEKRQFKLGSKICDDYMMKLNLS